MNYLLLAILSATAVGAPESGDLSNFLSDGPALAAWMEAHHPLLKAAKDRSLQAQADWDGSALLPNPAADFSLGDLNVGQSNPPGLHFHDTAIYNVGLSQTVELGKRGPRIEAARLRYVSAKKNYDDTLSHLVAAARLAIARVNYLQARLAILDESLKAAKSIAELGQKRLEHGDISGNDYDRLQLDSMQLETTEVNLTRSAYQDALRECAAALFEDCGVIVGSEAALDNAASVPVELRADEVLLRDRPDIAASELDRQAALQDLSGAKRRLIPDPTLRIGYTRDNLTISGDQQNTVMFSVGLPLPVFNRGQADAMHAQARAHELEEEHQALLYGATYEISSLLRRRDLLATTVDNLTKRAVPKSTGVVETTTQAFNRGQVSMTDLLLARRTHTSLLLSVVDARFEYFTIRNELRRAFALDLQGRGHQEVEE